MNKALILTCLALAALSSVSRAAESTKENLVINGSFEAGSDGGVPDYWTAEHASAVSRFTLEQPSAFGVKIESEVSFEEDPRYFIRQDNLPFEAGKSYTLTYRAKANPGVHYRIYCEVTHPEWQGSSLEFFLGNGEWQEHSIDVLFEDLKIAPYIIVQIGGPGSVMFSDISIVPSE